MYAKKRIVLIDYSKQVVYLLDLQYHYNKMFLDRSRCFLFQNNSYSIKIRLGHFEYFAY